ncbi:MAG: SDR family NAD(P)-dependent oxidoreductase [Alphaproteobacteria bacterium]
MNQYDLSDRTAVVTGGARGIGLGIAERFLRSGAKVSLWDTNAKGLAEATSRLANAGAVHTQVVDVTDSKMVNDAVAELERLWGRIDILCNNAGILGPRKAGLEHSDREWHDCVGVVLTGTYFCTRAVMTGMVVRGYGRIVNIASISGKEGSPMMPAYSAAKAGVIGLTKSLGREYGTSGVLVNCVTPATIETDMVKDLGEEYKAFVLARVPMKRYGRIEEIAALVTFLASEENSFETGGVFDISGGRSAY